MSFRAEWCGTRGLSSVTIDGDHVYRLTAARMKRLWYGHFIGVTIG